MDLSNTISHMIYKLIISMRFPTGFHILDAANVVSIIYHPLYNLAVNLKRKKRGSSMKFKFCRHHNIVITSRIYVFVYLNVCIIILSLSYPVRNNAQSSIVHYNLGLYCVLRTVYVYWFRHIIIRCIIHIIII